MVVVLRLDTAVVLVAAVVLQLFLVQVTVVKVVGYFPDQVAVEVVLVMGRVVVVDPPET
jgi:hypothetical protein